MGKMAEEKIEEIVDQIADEMTESEEEYDAAHEGETEVEEIVEEMADDMEATEEKDHQEPAGSGELTEGQEKELRMLEAILFASAEPLSPQAILERLPEGADLNVLMPELKKAYQGRGVEFVEISGQWALRTAQDVEEALVVEREVTKKLSKAALETLAIIAYHQPITRAEIENIRGVATHRGTLDILMELGWIKPGRRRETPGRPLTWMSTTSFLDHFQLESIMDLPGLDDLKASGLLDRRAAIETIPDTGDLFDSGDVDAEEVLDSNDSDLSDDDAYDEESYREMQEAKEEVIEEKGEEE